MWAHACHFTDDQVCEAALVTLITTSQSRISHDAFLSQWLPKFWSLGPIRGLLRALARYHPICTVKKKQNPAHQSVITSSPPEYTNALRSQPWTNLKLARPGLILPWEAGFNDGMAHAHLGENSSDKSEFIVTHAAKDEICHSNAAFQSLRKQRQRNQFFYFNTYSNKATSYCL